MKFTFEHSGEGFGCVVRTLAALKPFELKIRVVPRSITFAPIIGAEVFIFYKAITGYTEYHLLTGGQYGREN